MALIVKLDYEFVDHVPWVFVFDLECFEQLLIDLDETQDVSSHRVASFSDANCFEHPCASKLLGY